MSVRTPEAIQEAIVNALVGQTLTGTYLSCTLSRARVDQNADAGFEVINGSTVVSYQGGRAVAPGGMAPSGHGGFVRRQWAHSYRVRVTYSNRVAAGQDLARDVTSFARQVVNLIEAALEPHSGPVYDIPVDGIQLAAPAVHDRDPGFNVQDIAVTVRDFWARG